MHAQPFGFGEQLGGAQEWLAKYDAGDHGVHGLSGLVKPGKNVQAGLGMRPQ